MNAKSADFKSYSCRFTEHAAAYTSQDSEAAARIRATLADDQIVGPRDPKGPKFDPVDNEFKTGGGQPPPPPAPPIQPNDLGGLLGAPPRAPGAPHSGPMPPTPTSLPEPLQDFINNQLHGKPMRPMTGPPVDVDKLRAQILEQQREWEEYERLHPDLSGVNTEGIAASLLGMSAGDLSLLAGIVGAPETFTVSFWLGLGAWFLAQMGGAVGIGSSFH